MAKEISGSDGWLQSLVDIVHGKRLEEALDALSQFILSRFGVRIWFARMLGNRWSYIAGKISLKPSASEVQQIRLNDSVGLISDNWTALSGTKGSDLVMFLKWLVSSKRDVEDG